jgi:hypothetical protein
VSTDLTFTRLCGDPRSISAGRKVMKMDNADLAEFYSRPENQTVVGPGERRKPSGLSAHVPIRFSAALIGKVRELAGQDGLTVSSWIRNVIEREVQRRAPNSTSVSADMVAWDAGPPPAGQSATQSSARSRDLELAYS